MPSPLLMLHTRSMMTSVADAVHVNSSVVVMYVWFYLSGTGSPGYSRKGAVKRVCMCVL